MMYLELDERIKKEIKELLSINYEFKGNYLPYDSIEPLIEDLLSEIDNLKEKIEDLNCSNNDREDRYYDDMKLGLIY